MIAVDTNIVLRRLLNDDPAQSASANRLFDSHREILITDVVLAETIWTLAGRRYAVNKQGVVDAVMGLLTETNVLFESRNAIWAALNDFDDADGVDFADALIVNKARLVIERTGRSYRGTYSFDKATLALEGTRAL